jgi:NADH dehydrogenase (ubiquinone) 1 alpha subcomplex subunit 9
MAEVIADADVVVNMIGKYYETKTLADKKTFPYLEYKTNFSFEEANVTVPRMVAELCKEIQVDNLIHVSCAAAKEDASSEWARSKWRGEQAVKEVYPWATVIRPTQFFGHEDKLLNWFANMANRFPFVPYVNEGQALTQPVYIKDVADVISRVIDDPEQFEGRTIDCFGPQDYTYKELAAFVYDITGQEPWELDLPKGYVKTLGKILGKRSNPLITPDLAEVWSADFTPLSSDGYVAEAKKKDGILTFADFGITPTPIEKIAFEYLHRFRTGTHFNLAEGYHAHVK